MKITEKDLVFHILNVGSGDAILVELPSRETNGPKPLGIVDCFKSKKMLKYLKMLEQERQKAGITLGRMEFICATHPHDDHTEGIGPLMDNERTRPQEFWDSGFRHNSLTHKGILQRVIKHKIDMIRVSSGMERYFGTTQVTALSPSMALRNRYATYGVDMNNASIVLRFENRDMCCIAKAVEYIGVVDQEMLRDAGTSVAILGGDAEFDSWSYISAEFPCVTRAKSHEPLVTKMVNLLNCSMLKVSHHGSMHSAPLDVCERMSPSLAVISCKQKKQGKKGMREREMFPHAVTQRALEETCRKIVTTDGSYEKQGKPGTVIVAIHPGGKARYTKLTDTAGKVPESIPASI